MTASLTDRARRVVRRFATLRPPTGARARAAVAVAVLAAVAAGAGGHLLTRPDLPAGVALRVADREVTEAELDRRAEILGALYGIARPPDADGRDRFDRDLAKTGRRRSATSWCPTSTPATS